VSDISQLPTWLSWVADEIGAIEKKSDFVIHGENRNILFFMLADI